MGTAGEFHVEQRATGPDRAVGLTGPVSLIPGPADGAGAGALHPRSHGRRATGRHGAHACHRQRLAHIAARERKDSPPPPSDARRAPHWWRRMFPVERRPYRDTSGATDRQHSSGAALPSVMDAAVPEGLQGFRRARPPVHLERPALARIRSPRTGVRRALEAAGRVLDDVSTIPHDPLTAPLRLDGRGQRNAALPLRSTDTSAAGAAGDPAPAPQRPTGRACPRTRSPGWPTTSRAPSGPGHTARSQRRRAGVACCLRTVRSGADRRWRAPPSQARPTIAGPVATSRGGRDRKAHARRSVVPPAAASAQWRPGQSGRNRLLNCDDARRCLHIRRGQGRCKAIHRPVGTLTRNCRPFSLFIPVLRVGPEAPARTPTSAGRSTPPAVPPAGGRGGAAAATVSRGTPADAPRPGHEGPGACESDVARGVSPRQARSRRGGRARGPGCDWRRLPVR